MNDTATETPTVSDAKAELRSVMRLMRRGLPDLGERSRAIADHLDHLEVVRAARHVMVFSTIPGEPDAAAFIASCAARRQVVMTPEEDPDPAWPDVVVVPGIAFTRTGERLGQGGGWYDRFLSDTRDGCSTIGVAFEPQVIAELPVDEHDMSVDAVVTEEGVWWAT